MFASAGRLAPALPRFDVVAISAGGSEGLRKVEDGMIFVVGVVNSVGAVTSARRLSLPSWDVHCSGELRNTLANDWHSRRMKRLTFYLTRLGSGGGCMLRDVLPFLVCLVDTALDGEM